MIVEKTELQILLYEDGYVFVVGATGQHRNELQVRQEKEVYQIVSLFDLKIIKKPDIVPEKIKDLIRRRRLQVIVHSCIYYRLNNNLISDFQYDKWSKELAKLHKQYGVIKINCYDEYFEDWIFELGKTYSGFKLPINDLKIIGIAEDLIKTAEGKKK